jgi:hypothetical protein
MCCQVRGKLDHKQCARAQSCVRSIVRSAFNHNAIDHTSIVCSTLDHNAFDREVCDRSHVTALKSHNASKLAIAARVTRSSWADEACDRSRVLRSIAPSAH